MSRCASPCAPCGLARDRDSRPETGTSRMGILPYFSTQLYTSIYPLVFVDTFSARAGPSGSVARVCTASCRPARSRNGVCVKSYIVASGYARKDNTFSGTFPHLRTRRAPNPFFQRDRRASGTVHNPGPTCKHAGDNVLLSLRLPYPGRPVMHRPEPETYDSE